MPLVLGADAADAGASGAGTGSGASGRAPGLGSTGSFAASFSSCCLYRCAAWEVYCRQQGGKELGNVTVGFSTPTEQQAFLFRSCRKWLKSSSLGYSLMACPNAICGLIH